ncbi:MAG: hypothetical protein H6709_20510 [Kofleriaceae bacterium]|nr:hypothetical protein [Kofleriaceae bacterium]MCB9574465.1 hypothetical protein [Kofleriaceae bacterium]
MAKPRLDLTALFEPTAAAPRAAAIPYRSLDAELDAVRRRAKPIAWFASSRDDLADGGDVAALIGPALDRGLAAIVHPDDASGAVPGYDGVGVAVLHLDQAWRVQALRALWATALAHGGWTDAAEDQLGALLGYTPAQRAAWLADVRHRQAAWGCTTIYTLLTATQRARVRGLGQRCLGTPADLDGLAVFVHGRGHALRADAHRRIAPGLTIARVGVSRAAAAAIFGPPPARRPRGVVSANVTAEVAATLNAELRSDVQLLGARGWR